MSEARPKANRRIHVEFCYQLDSGDVSLPQFTELIQRMLPGGALVTVTEHKGGYCVAGNGDNTGGGS